jgi:hypothetical protein
MNRPLTTAALVDAIDKIYTVVDGPARAFFEFPVPGIAGDAVARVTYESVSVSAPGDDESAEALLSLWFYTALAGLLTEELQEDHGVVLFWRRRPQVHVYSDTDGKTVTKLTARLAIPGYSLEHLREVKL